MKVSVVIPVYNAEKYLRQAVESCWDLEDVGEVLLVEDCSADKSLEVSKELANESDKVMLLRHPDGENRGAGASRNLGIRRARCKYIAFLDADDLYLPNRFNASLRLLENSSIIDGTYGAVGTIYENETLRKWWLDSGHSEVTCVEPGILPGDLAGHFLLHGTHCHTNGVTVRRKFFEKCGFFDEDLRMGQDTHLWIRMAMVGTMVNCGDQDPISQRRLHPGNRIYQCQGLVHARWRELLYRKLAKWARTHKINPDLVELSENVSFAARSALAHFENPKQFKHQWRFYLFYHLMVGFFLNPHFVFRKRWWKGLGDVVGFRVLVKNVVNRR